VNTWGQLRPWGNGLDNEPGTDGDLRVSMPDKRLQGFHYQHAFALALQPHLDQGMGCILTHPVRFHAEFRDQFFHMLAGGCWNFFSRSGFLGFPGG